MPLNIPTGEMVFIDANIFYYHFVSLLGLSIACQHVLVNASFPTLTSTSLYYGPDVADFPLSLMYGALSRSRSTPMIMSDRTCTLRKKSRWQQGHTV